MNQHLDGEVLVNGLTVIQSHRRHTVDLMTLLAGSLAQLSHPAAGGVEARCRWHERPALGLAYLLLRERTLYGSLPTAYSPIVRCLRQWRRR